MTKLFSSEAYKKHAGWFVDMAGPSGLLREDDPTAPVGGALDEHFRGARVTTIYGGTSEIARNLIVDAHRDNVRDQRIAAAALDDAPALDDDDDRKAFRLVARSLPMFIAALEPPYRDALTMTELEGLTQAEAAERAGISLSGMKSRVQRGRQKVRDALVRCCEIETDVRGKVTDFTPRESCGCRQR